MSKGRRGARAGHRNRLTDRRLWDEDGKEWEYVTNQVRAAEVEKLIKQDLKFCAHGNYGAPPEWLSREQAQGFWESTASKDYAGEVATVKRPNKRPWQVSIFKNGKDRLVLFDTD
ncbi:MAG: hypothetical protein WD627_02885 [Actinomycetota bacterium]